MGAGASVAGVSCDELEKMMMDKFVELDVDKTNSLENSELGVVVDWTLENFGDRIGADKDAAKEKIMSLIDTNKDGKLDKDEFRVLYHQLYERSLMIEKARVKFAEFDPENKGYIDSERIKQVAVWVLSAYPVDNMDTFTKRLVDTIDINNDGNLSLLEFTNLFEQMLARMDLIARAKAKFMELDKDHSGQLDGEEIDELVTWAISSSPGRMTEKQREAKRKALMAQVDFNADGMVSLAEFADIFADMQERADLVEQAGCKFRELDVDHSGFLEGAELIPLVREWTLKFCKIHSGNSGMETSSEALMEEFMHQVDADKDNKIDINEFLLLFADIITAFKPAVVAPVAVF